MYKKIGYLCIAICTLVSAESEQYEYEGPLEKADLLAFATTGRDDGYHVPLTIAAHEHQSMSIDAVDLFNPVAYSITQKYESKGDTQKSDTQKSNLLLVKSPLLEEESHEKNLVQLSTNIKQIGPTQQPEENPTQEAPTRNGSNAEAAINESLSEETLKMKSIPPAESVKDTETASNMAAIGAILCDDGEVDLGLSLIHDAISSSEDVKYYLQRAEILLDLKRTDEALADCIKAVTLDSTKLETLLLQATILQKLKRADAAIEIYGKILSHYHNEPQALYNRAQLFTEKDSYEEAIEDISTLLSDKPELISAYFLRAGILREVKQFEYAIEDYRKIYALDSTHFAATYEMAMTFGESHQLDSMKWYMDIFIEKSLGEDAFNTIMHNKEKTALQLK